MIPTTTDGILDRVTELEALNQNSLLMRKVTRAVCEGGASAVQALLPDADLAFMPSANLIHSGIERLSQRLKTVPSIRVDTQRGNDTATARSRAEKKERIVESYDEMSNVHMQMPQAARWTAGYGFTPWVIEPKETVDGRPYPDLQLRDPFSCLPGPWTVHQQPQDIAFIRNTPKAVLQRQYPGINLKSRSQYNMVGGIPLLMSPATASHGNWESQGSDDLFKVVEYRSAIGTALILEQGKVLLDFVPTPTNVGAGFVVAKRFSFSQLQGQFEHGFGLQQMLARLTVMAFLSVSDSVFAEVNIIGKLIGDEYKRGRGQTNEFEMGSSVQKIASPNQAEAFAQQDRIEQSLRNDVGYPRIDDANSPSSFITGQGTRELRQPSDATTEEYQLVFRDALRRADHKRLAWDDAEWGSYKRALPIYSPDEPSVEKYRPDRDISGSYRTRRIYGMLSGMDSSSKLVGMLQISSAGWLDDITATEEIDGIDDVQKVRERLAWQKAENMLEQATLSAAQGQPLDLRVLRVILDQLQPGPVKDKYEDVFFPEEDPAAAAPNDPGLAPPGAEEPLAAPGEDPQTVLTRLFAGGQETSAAQVVN